MEENISAPETQKSKLDSSRLFQQIFLCCSITGTLLLGFALGITLHFSISTFQTQLEALKKQKAAIEMIRQEDSKRLERYLKVAQRHYLQQRDEIVAQMEQSVSGEEKMKLFLLLALTEQDFENLRRTSDGHKS